MFLGVLLSLIGTVAQDVVGSFGCTMPICVLSNSYLRFGTGAETSVNAWGLFQQPWYYSSIGSAWYKLTFNTYPLDTAIGLGTGGPNWSGATVTDVYTLTATASSTNYSAFVVTSSDTTKSVGHGIIISLRKFSVLGYSLWLENTFSLGSNDSFVRVTSRVINNSSSYIPNVILWVGTRDDFVGTTDVNTKTRGNLASGGFTAVTANNQSSRAIMITNTNEGVLFYSDTESTMTAYALCCSFSNVYNTYPLSLAPATGTPTDGSYAAILPVGNVSTGGSASITWYYAAGTISSLSTVVQSVAVAQAVFSGAVASDTATTTATATATASATATATASSSARATFTATASSTATSTASSTGSVTGSTTGTSTTTSTANPTASPAPSPSPTATVTTTAIATGTLTLTGSATSTATMTSTTTGTPSITATPKASASVSTSASATNSPRSSLSSFPSRTATRSASQSKSISLSALSTTRPTWTLLPTATPVGSFTISYSAFKTAVATSTGTSSASVTSTPTPTATPSTTSTLAIKVLIAQVPAFNITSVYTTSTTIVQVNSSDGLVYIPITLIILGVAGYMGWKKWKAWKAKKAQAAATAVAEVVAATAVEATVATKAAPKVQVRQPTKV